MRSATKPTLPAWGLLVGAVLLILSACGNPVSSQRRTEPSSGDRAGLRLSFSTPPTRTVAASPGDFSAAIATLAIAVVDDEGQTVAQAPSLPYGPGTTKTFDSLSPGTYTVQVNVYGASGNLLGSGVCPAVLSPGTLQAVTVPLVFGNQGTSTGGFALKIEWPLSTGLASVYATLDGAPLADPGVTVGASTYSATLAATGVPSGAHLLSLYFKATQASTTLLGPYVEAVNVWDGVTSSCWVDQNGACAARRLFEGTEFSSSSALLANVGFTGVSLAGAFSSGTLEYGLTGLSGTSISFSADSASTTQNLSYRWNGVVQTWAGGSGTNFLSTTLSLAPGTNTLEVIVTAADRWTTATYTFHAPVLLTSSNISTLLAADPAGTFVLDGDLSLPSWTPVGDPGTPFTGAFDGRGHTISVTLSSGSDYTGLFGAVGPGGVVKDLTLVGSVQGNRYVGGIAGLNQGTLSGCVVTATVSGVGEGVGSVAGINEGTLEGCSARGNVSGTRLVGGLAGSVEGAGVVRRGSFTGTVYATGDSSGGLVGWVGPGATVSECYVTGGVNASGSDIGGLVGLNEGNVATSYSRGPVLGDTRVGGLIGRNAGSASDSYATGTVGASGSPGALVGANLGTSSGCYVSDPGDPTYYSASLGAAVPSGWSTALWGWSSTLNDAYPYLLFFGSATQVP